MCVCLRLQLLAYGGRLEYTLSYDTESRDDPVRIISAPDVIIEVNTFTLRLIGWSEINCLLKLSAVAIHCETCSRLSQPLGLKTKQKLPLQKFH